MAELIAVLASGCLVLALLALGRSAHALKLQAALLTLSRDEVRLWKRKYDLLEQDYQAVVKQRDVLQSSLAALKALGDIKAALERLPTTGQRKERVH